MGMMEHNKITGILPMTTVQLNQTKYLKYDITSKVKMSELFSGNVKKEMVVKCFLSIMNTLINAEDYMLNLEDFLIDMDHIYVTLGKYETELVCLPITDEKKTDAVKLELFVKNIIFSAKYDQTENCDYVAKIISFLNSQPFAINKFKEVLEEILDDNNVQLFHSADVKVSQKDELTPISVAAPENPVYNSIKPAFDTVVNNNTVDAFEISDKKALDLSNSVSEKKEKKGFFARRKDKVKKKEKSDKKCKETEMVQLSGMASEMIIPGQKVVSTEDGKSIGVNVNNSDNEVTGVVQKANLTKLPNTTFNHVKGSFGETTVLGVGGGSETTILGVNSLSSADNRAYLIRRRNNEKKYIDKDVYRIGKENSFVDYFIGDNTAISRSHANIIKKITDYYIVDMNSKNHTYVNGTMLQPNIETLLQPGTKIRLADEEFEFNLE
ncbi:MAG: FHA domain-containing protein [Lachnospiraceae bacterium]|nr:FHA domain-containing protein [Lachnospiraceae bacterium]